MRRPCSRPRAWSKLIADQEHDDMLGVHIVGPLAGELIAEAVLAMEFRRLPRTCSGRFMRIRPSAKCCTKRRSSADKRAIHGINR